MDDSWMAGGEPRSGQSEESTPTQEMGQIPSSYRRRDWRVVRHTVERSDWEEDQDERQFLATVIWTIAWYAVPTALYTVWTLTFDPAPGTACAHPVGSVCPPVRSTALDVLWHGLPWFCTALLLSLLLALLIRLGSAAWRPVTAAFSAAVIGAGVATILFSALAS